MGRGDVIEVPRVNRPPDPMVVPKRPNVWSFNTAFPPDQIGALLGRTVGAKDGPRGAEPIVGAFTPDGALLHKRPASRRSAKFPLTLAWTAHAQGSQVTCRMPLPMSFALFVGGSMIVALGSLSAVPKALMAMAVHADHVVGLRGGSPVSKLIVALVMAVIVCFIPRFIRAAMDRDRAFLMDHVTRVLEAGPVREARE